MRRFVYYLRNRSRYSLAYTEQEVLHHKEYDMFAGDELFELVPREIKTVTRQEIV